MSSAVWEELGTRFGARLQVDEPLSRHTTYRIGGPAAALISPVSTEEVAAALEFCRVHGVAWLPLGLGSNVLISDDGFSGLVLKMGKGFDAVLDRSEDDTVWRVAAGMPTPRLARQTAAAGLAGMHKLVGIPGTVGGGVATNAGAHGQEYASVVRSVECVAADGSVIDVVASNIEWSYRKGLEGVLVTGATFDFKTTDSESLEQDIQRVNAARKENTPFDSPCCGSVFKNPGGSNADEAVPTAGKLIDSVGLKGFRVGAAEVSKLHANYIVNLGGATAEEVMAVIETVRGRVFGAFGVELELEVRIID